MPFLSSGVLISLVSLVVALNTHGGPPGAWRARSKPHVPRDVPVSTKLFQFQSVDQYGGPDFLNDTLWIFTNGTDPTGGQVNYLSRADAAAESLAYVQTDGTTVLRVDSSKDLPNGVRRDSVRIHSTRKFLNGLVIADFAAMPFGCSVWPAWWTEGDKWPSGGEIDIIEGVNSMPMNQYTFHSGPGGNCNIPKTPPMNEDGEPAFTSNVLGTNCTSFTGHDAGCGFDDKNASSFGEGFNNAGGGIFALLRDSESIKIWHFDRQSIPSDAHSGHPNPSSWPSPNALLSSDECDIDSQFPPQTLVLDVDVCGGWPISTYSYFGCPGTCAEQVTSGKNFINAMWVINNITVYNS
ncbi:concanavalin A-like lectin/glucanase domain-containing protein [Russula compacta]|nr:concanavalin A-like lectin/glucanase domain-containing protein [Russula compacta]